MNDKELIKKLNNLRNIMPDDGWKKGQRDVLFSQISLGLPAKEAKSSLSVIWQAVMPRQILISLARPVWLMFLASLLILTVGIGGVFASKNSKPGDSLYIAKIISEKTQFAMTFSEKDKAKLAVDFATNRAKEITLVLKEADQADQARSDKLAALSQNFKKEISQVKSRLVMIKAAADKQADKQALKNDKDQEAEDEFKVFGADSGKSDQRMEISEPAPAPKPASPSRLPEEEDDEDDDNSGSQARLPDGQATSSRLIMENQSAVSATSTAEKVNQADRMLTEAEELFDQENYDGTIDKLKQAKKVITQTESGKVKGASESAASTTEEIK